MSKKKYMFLLCAMMLTLVACGKENNTSDVKNENQQITNMTTEDVGEESVKDNDADVLLGVYDGATDYMELPMGTFFEGEQKEFCKVKIPMEYVASANYVDENGTSLVNEAIYGIKVENIDLSESNIVNQGVIVANVDGTDVNFVVVSSDVYTLEERKASAEENYGGYQEIEKSGGNAIYFLIEEYGTEAVMAYKMNEDSMIQITYKGKLLDKIGLEELAERLYDLVEVVE